MRLPSKITRTELYNLVWSTPTIRLTKVLGYSDVGIAKICRRHKIPRPSRGYWAKKQFGRAPRQAPLPDPTNDCIIELQGRDMSDPEPHNRVKVELPQIKVAESLRGCHSLISQANQELQAATADTNGLLVLAKEPVLEARVSKRSLRRALLIVDAVLRTCEALGYSVHQGPCVKIQDTSVRFGITEILETKQEPVREHDLDGRYDFGYNRFTKKRIPSGRLELFIHQTDIYWENGRRGTWRDGKKPLEERLNGFVTGLIEMAARTKAIQEEGRRQAELRQAEELRRQEEARQLAEKRERFKAEHARVEGLRQQARNWKEAENLRSFVEAAKQKYLERHGTIEPAGELAQWLEWALQQADRLDPLRPSPPSILDEKIEEVKHESSPRRAW